MRSPQITREALRGGQDFWYIYITNSPQDISQKATKYRGWLNVIPYIAEEVLLSDLAGVILVAVPCVIFLRFVHFIFRSQPPFT